MFFKFEERQQFTKHCKGLSIKRIPAERIFCVTISKIGIKNVAQKERKLK